ncbi:MAG: yvdB [Nitrospira sp.]|jgi:MFS superfamily sulfate permease-like transporter|nr:yvdB [Nitrospira sp.]
MTPHDPPRPELEKPGNGVHGLKHWRYDLLAGLQVSLVGLPLSLGIAVASGAPPVTGVISAIIAGLIFPFLGGAYVTISGPAAGLAPALLAGMLTLGQGDLTAGYPLVLVAICLTGLVQVLLSIMRAGKYAIVFPISVVEGMLAAIGLMIIVKQIPALVGHLTPPVKSIPAAIGQIPENFFHLNSGVLFIGGISLALLFFLSKKKDRWATLIPPPLLVVGLSILMGWLLQLPSTYLIQVPGNVLEQGLHAPGFFEVWQRPDLWMSLLMLVVTLTLIDGTESLATIAAVDKIDPFRRKSDPNRTLRAMGISNLLSSLAGGLTIIPGGMKSSTNVYAGGRTLWANFYYALFLMLFLWGGTGLINRIPLATLAAVLIYVGWRLCEPRVFRKILTVGREQLLLFTVTIMATLLLTDLLLGIIIGMLTKFALLSFHLAQSSFRQIRADRLSFRQSAGLVLDTVAELFMNPVIRLDIGKNCGIPAPLSVMSKAESVAADGAEALHRPCRITLSSVTCANLIKLEKVMSHVLPRYTTFLVTVSGRIIDHTSMEYLHHFQEECLQAGHTCRINGFENFHAFSDHALSTRMNHRPLQSIA